MVAASPSTLGTGAVIILSPHHKDGRAEDPLKLTATLIIALSVASFAPAQTSTTSAPATTSATNLIVRHVIGLDPIKRNATGQLTIQDNALEFKSGKDENKLTISSIDDIFIGTETTQSGGKKGTAVKTAAIAAPYGSGRALSLMMRTKVDILTVSYHDPDGAVHGAIFALPIGQAEPMRAQLISAGAHASLSEEKASAGSKQ
jgi:hypothetical protein